MHVDSIRGGFLRVANPPHAVIPVKTGQVFSRTRHTRPICHFDRSPSASWDEVEKSILNRSLHYASGSSRDDDWVAIVGRARHRRIAHAEREYCSEKIVNLWTPVKKVLY